jgi:S-disulfanyl-L-cysteine oxidoreductase SoxD
VKIRIGIAAIIGLSSIGALRFAPAAQEPTETTHSVWDGVYTAEQEKRGAEQYSSVCAHCHGEDLAGNDEAAPLTGPAFLANWDGLTVGDLAERIFRTMPQNDPGHLSRQQIADIIAHMLNFNGFPAGKTELDRRVEVLRQIRIEATKPSPKFDRKFEGSEARPE